MTNGKWLFVIKERFSRKINVFLNSINYTYINNNIHKAVVMLYNRQYLCTAQHNVTRIHFFSTIVHIIL